MGKGWEPSPGAGAAPVPGGSLVLCMPVAVHHDVVSLGEVSNGCRRGSVPCHTPMGGDRSPGLCCCAGTGLAGAGSPQDEAATEVTGFRAEPSCHEPQVKVEMGETLEELSWRRVNVSRWCPEWSWGGWVCSLTPRKPVQAQRTSPFCPFLSFFPFSIPPASSSQRPARG